MNHRSRCVVGRSSMNHRLNNWSMVGRSSMNYRSSMVNRSRCMVGRGRDSCRSIVCSCKFLIITISMNTLWRSMRLTDNTGVSNSVGFVDGVTHRWSVPLLDGLVMGLVTQGYTQDGGDTHKYLHVIS